MTAETDYPQMAAARGRIEPAPRRVRGYLGDALVFDTTAARYVWEVPYYPQYYIPLDDVRSEFLRDENHAQKVQFGASRLYSLVGAGQTHEAAARVFDAGGDGPIRLDGSVDSSIPDALPPLDVQPPIDANRNDCPDADSTYVYLVSASTELYSFYPPDETYRFIGNLVCPTQDGNATPFSMAVDRKGKA